MARTIAVIQAQIVAYKNAQTALSGLTSPSQTAKYTTWIFIQAVAINLFEQLLDIFKADFETKVNASFTGSPSWVKDKVFKFQYDATTPQITQLINFIPSYPIVDATKLIVTRCTVKTLPNNVVSVKVAQQEPPIALTAPQLASLTGYLSQGGNGTLSGYGTGIGFAGVTFVPQSFTSDKLYLSAQIIYNGQYSSVIQTNVINAINLYLKNIPFDGLVRVVDLIGAILPDYDNGILINGVDGVIDLIITDLAIRADTTPFTSKTYLVQSKLELLSSYPTYAGYIVGETTTLNTLTDTLTFTAQ